MKAVAEGALDKVKVEELASTLGALKAATIVDKVIKVYDVEWKLLDILADTRIVHKIPGIGYGFSVRSKAATG